MNIDYAKIAAEKAFHDDRIRNDAEVRGSQKKFYTAINDCKKTYEDLVQHYARDKDVLEYGCFFGNRSLQIAPIAKSVTGIDISDLAIEKAKNTAGATGAINVQFIVMNAEAMDFPNESFDVVFGSGILHHLALDKAYSEIARVLRPGGKAIFIEPFGHNIVVNLYRLLTPRARTIDEHPLLWRDLTMAGYYFERVHMQPYGLTTLAGVPFYKTQLQKPIMKILRGIDRLLFKFPYLQRQAWVGLLEFTK